MAYVLGMAVTFSVLGVAAAVTGSLFGQIQSNPVSNILVGAIIIIFALSMLDVIPLPVFLLSRLGAGKITKKAGVLPAFAMGVASGFVAAPCTTAVIGALLAFVATTQNIALGFSLLFTFALGIGVLLVIVGTFTGFLNSFKVSPVWVVLSGKIMAFVLMIAGCYFIYKAGTLS
jgi:thiol:disulfide interchange protein DsbD